MISDNHPPECRAENNEVAIPNEAVCEGRYVLNVFNRHVYILHTEELVYFKLVKSV